MDTQIEPRRVRKESNAMANVLTLAVFAGVVGAATAAAYKIGEQSAAAETRQEIAIAKVAIEQQRAPLLAEIAQLKSERDALRKELQVAQGIDSDLRKDLDQDAELLARLGPLVCVDGIRLVKRGESWVRVGEC